MFTLLSYIDLGGRYTDAPLTIVIFAKDKRIFLKARKHYADKQICVTGMIKEYKGKLEIDVESRKEIILE